jgi:queuosine biosynthesis protein QueC
MYSSFKYKQKNDACVYIGGGSCSIALSADLAMIDNPWIGKRLHEGNYNEENMRSTVVPFRNGIMLSIAAGLAENEGLKYVMMANHSGDHAIYPDCTPEFAAAMSAATKTGTANGVELFAPYTNLTKTDIVKKGVKLGVDYEKTWSCYKGGKEPCGVCGTCREREEAFKAAGVKIPVKPKKDNKDKK